jgi:hypothetical protein
VVVIAGGCFATSVSSQSFCFMVALPPVVSLPPTTLAACASFYGFSSQVGEVVWLGWVPPRAFFSPCLSICDCVCLCLCSRLRPPLFVSHSVLCFGRLCCPFVSLHFGGSPKVSYL